MLRLGALAVGILTVILAGLMVTVDAHPKFQPVALTLGIIDLVLIFLVLVAGSQEEKK